MAEKLNPKETVSLKEVVMSNVFTQEALVNLLEEKMELYTTKSKGEA